MYYQVLYIIVLLSNYVLVNKVIRWKKKEDIIIALQEDSNRDNWQGIEPEEDRSRTDKWSYKTKKMANTRKTRG